MSITDATTMLRKKHRSYFSVVMLLYSTFQRSRIWLAAFRKYVYKLAMVSCRVLFPTGELR